MGRRLKVGPHHTLSPSFPCDLHVGELAGEAYRTRTFQTVETEISHTIHLSSVIPGNFASSRWTSVAVRSQLTRG